jgi:DNA-binding transcriptional LysR family regulator
MLTFKQLEAVYWIAQLGGFNQAALKLHTTQSAISKRIQELESIFATELFDRSQRSARLTDKGEEMFVLAKRLLNLRDEAVEQFSRPEVMERRVRIGVTELTAMTWLPRLVDLIQRYYPKVIIEPVVDLSAELRLKLLADEVELIITPDAFADNRLATKEVGKVENAWMCKPGMIQPRKSMRLHELASHRLLIQGDSSGTGLLYDRWFKSLGLQLDNTIRSNSLIALIGMTVSGLGISYLPRRCLEPMIDSGDLLVVKATPALPETHYVATYKTDQRSTLLASIVMLAQESCDFTRMFQTQR